MAENKPYRQAKASAPFLQARAFLKKVQDDKTISYPVIVSEVVPNRVRADLSSSFSVGGPDDLDGIISGLSTHALITRVIANRHIIYIDILSGSSREDKPDDAAHTDELYEKHMPELVEKASRLSF